MVGYIIRLSDMMCLGVFEDVLRIEKVGDDRLKIIGRRGTGESNDSNYSKIIVIEQFIDLESYVDKFPSDLEYTDLSHQYLRYPDETIISNLTKLLMDREIITSEQYMEVTGKEWLPPES